MTENATPYGKTGSGKSPRFCPVVSGLATRPSPVVLKHGQPGSVHLGIVPVPCVGPDCLWYSRTKQKCVVFAIADAFSDLLDVLQFQREDGDESNGDNTAV